MQTEPRKQTDTWRIVVSAVGVMVILAVQLSWERRKMAPPARAPRSVSAGGRQANASRPQPGQSAWREIARWSGSGTKNTETFTVGGEWAIVWKTWPGQFGNQLFTVFVYDAGGTMVDMAANVVGAASDTSYIHRAGTFYLQLVASQPYSVSIMEKR